MNKLQAKDINIIGRFTEVWCAGHSHPERNKVNIADNPGSFLLCQECAEFLKYAAARRLNCPIEAEKPSCKHCRIHCYAPKQREMVRKIMAWSGRKMILRGRLDYLWHYFF